MIRHQRLPKRWPSSLCLLPSVILPSIPLLSALYQLLSAILVMMAQPAMRAH